KLADRSRQTGCNFALFFSFSSPPPTQISTLSLHDALPILERHQVGHDVLAEWSGRQAADAGFRERGVEDRAARLDVERRPRDPRSEEHTSELQSPYDLVCRLLLEKKKTETGPVIAIGKRMD